MWPLFSVLKDHADVVIAVGAAVGGGWRYVVMPARARWRARGARIREFRTTMLEGARAMGAVEKDMALVKKELFPNGGGSLRDTLDHVVASVHELRRTNAASSDFVRALACEAGVVILQFDSDGQLIWATERWYKLTGLTIDQAGGTGWVNALYIDDRERIDDRWKDAVANQRAFIDSFRFQHVHTGAVVAVRVEALPTVSGDAARPIGWVATMTVTTAAAA
jgi:PAS domain-containing protein